MIIIGATRDDLESALAKVNEHFGCNIVWNRWPEALNKTGQKHRLTLRCVSSKGLGHRVSYPCPYRDRPSRHLVSACWHVHGHFFDALFALRPEATVQTREGVMREGENWQDYNIGSQMFPFMASEACDCP